MTKDKRDISSAVPNTRRRIATKTSLEDNKSDGRTVAVTTQESLDGGAENDRHTKVNETVRALVGLVIEGRRHCRCLRQQVKEMERHEFEASNTKLEHEICRRCEESRISVVGKLVKRSQMGKLVKKNEMCDRKIGKMVKKNEITQKLEKWISWKIREKDRDEWSTSRKEMKKVETGGVKVGELVKKIHMNEPTVGKVWRSVGVSQEEYLKPEQDAILAAAGEEDGFIKCLDDTTGKELLWQAVMEAREKKVRYLCEPGVFDKLDERAAVAEYDVTPADTKWVDTDKAFEWEPL